MPPSAVREAPATAGLLDPVKRRASVFWRAGEYPFADQPAYSMTAEENRAAVAEFTPVPIVDTHHGSLLDGRLGMVTSLFPAKDDHSELGLEAEIPLWLHRLFEGQPLEISANWDRRSKRLRNVALVPNPRIDGAALLDACFAAEEEAAAGGMPADGMDTAYGDPNVPAPATQPATGPDPALTSTLLVTGDEQALMTLKALAERMGVICEYSPGTTPEEGPSPATAGEAPMSAATAPAATAPRAPTPHTGSLGRRLADAERRATLATQRAEAAEARFSALEARLKALEDGSATAAFERQVSLIEKDAALFAREVADRVLPYQRPHLLAEYRQAALDDARHPEEVHFSKDGAAVKGSRVEALRARYQALPKHGLTVEAMPDRPEASFGYEPPTDRRKADPERVSRILKSTDLGRDISRNGSKQ